MKGGKAWESVHPRAWLQLPWGETWAGLTAQQSSPAERSRYLEPSRTQFMAQPMIWRFTLPLLSLLRSTLGTIAELLWVCLCLFSMSWLILCCHCLFFRTATTGRRDISEVVQHTKVRQYSPSLITYCGSELFVLPASMYNMPGCPWSLITFRGCFLKHSESPDLADKFQASTCKSDVGHYREQLGARKGQNFVSQVM